MCKAVAYVKNRKQTRVAGSEGGGGKGMKQSEARNREWPDYAGLYFVF